MPIEIAPALKPDEWAARKRDYLILDRIGGEEYVVIDGPDGEEVNVAGADALFAMIALANHALPADDPRKFTHDHVRRLREALLTLEEGDSHAEVDEDLDALTQLVIVVSALLPPRKSE
jgi:hypothetical protein